jgi:hypothetical protein
MGVVGDYAVMPTCPNCRNEMQSRMKFCPERGQDQSIVVSQDQRIRTERVSVPPPPPPSGGQGGSARPRRKWLIGLLGCGGLVGLLLVALIVVAAVSGPTDETAQSVGEGQENDEEEKKPAETKKSGSENPVVAIGEPAELRDRSLLVNEVQHNYPPARFQKLEPGNDLMRIYITLRNTGDQAINYNPLDFKVQDSNGVQKNYQIMSELPSSLEYGSLAPDGRVEGNLAFEVPQGDNNPPV